MSKWKSRKFWIGLIGAISGVLALTVGTMESEKFAIVAGAVLSIVCALGYIKAEKEIDIARIKSEGK